MMHSSVAEMNVGFGDVRRIAFFPSGHDLAIVGNAPHVCVWTLNSNTQKHYELVQKPKRMHGVAISPNGRQLAAATYDGRIVLWDTDTRDMQLSLPGHRYSANCVVFSPSGEELISSGNDGRVKVWNASVPRKRARMSVNAHSGVVETVTVSPNGRYIAWGGGMDAKGLIVGILELASRTEISNAAKHADDIVSVAFSPCSNVVASGSWDNSVTLFNLSKQEVIATFTTKQNKTVNSVCFSPDGQLLVAGGHGGYLYVWNILNLTLLGVWHAHNDILWCTKFSPTGGLIASSGYDATVRLWQVP